jgi:hypothetical protein
MNRNCSGRAAPNSDVTGPGEHFEIDRPIDLEGAVKRSRDRSETGQRTGKHE